MRKLLETKNTEEIRKSIWILYTFSTLTMALFILTRAAEKAFFNIGFFIELLFVFTTLRFYGRSLINKNYAFWGISFVLGMYIFFNILQYTFIHYNIFILYIAFLSAVFLATNCYIMSSPLYFPRIQWWEYDFRYRGDLKAEADINNEEEEIRVSDLRREAVSFMSFNILKLGDEALINVSVGEKTFSMKGILKTAREDIPGRPIRYGMKLNLETEKARKDLAGLKKIWDEKKVAIIRRKFADYTIE